MVFEVRKTIDGLDGSGLLKPYVFSMEGQMAAGAFGRARKYGWDGLLNKHWTRGEGEGRPQTLKRTANRQSTHQGIRQSTQGEHQDWAFKQQLGQQITKQRKRKYNGDKKKKVNTK